MEREYTDIWGKTIIDGEFYVVNLLDSNVTACALLYRLPSGEMRLDSKMVCLNISEMEGFKKLNAIPVPDPRRYADYLIAAGGITKRLEGEWIIETLGRLLKNEEKEVASESSSQPSLCQ